MPQRFSAINQSLNNSMACGQLNGTTIQLEVSALAQKLKNAIDKCYNDKMLKKTTM